jgi:hypothetical protein
MAARGLFVALYRCAVRCSHADFAELWALRRSNSPVEALAVESAVLRQIVLDVAGRTRPCARVAYSVTYSTDGELEPLQAAPGTTLYCYTFNAPGSPARRLEVESSGELWHAVVHSGDLVVCRAPSGLHSLVGHTSRAHCRGQRIVVLATAL